MNRKPTHEARHRNSERKNNSADSTSGPLPSTPRVGRLRYLNVAPFFLNNGPDVVLSVSPRRLGEEALEDRVDAGPFSLADAWRLEADFEPLGGFGIAVRGPARSVLLFSKKPMNELGNSRIGITDQTATSVKLLTVLLELREGVRADFRRGFSDEDEARLVIGDDALTPSPEIKAAFPRVFDLGREWYLWRERPFVFAKWMVRRSISDDRKAELVYRLDASLRRFERDPDLTARLAAEGSLLSAVQIRNYLSTFVYRLGSGEREAEEQFRSMASGLFADREF
jgi:chorismate dehydratase